jgi:Ca-activated chloride channel family protein
MRFADPHLLFLLPLLPFLFYFIRRRRDEGAALVFPVVQELRRLATPATVRLHRALPLLRLLVLALCIVALARPQWGIQATRITREGIAIAMVVDISGSMAAQDLKIDDQQSDRLEVVKQTFRLFVTGDGTDGSANEAEAEAEDKTSEREENRLQELADLKGREGDLIGLLTFARFTDALSPLTLDHAALLKLLEQVEIVSLAEEDGTAIGDAIVMGVENLRKAGGAGKVMIVLTDGSNNAGDTSPLQAAQVARALDIKMYTIGTGSRGIAMMPVQRSDGSSYLLPAQVYIDEDTLTQVAELTGGKYFRATDSEALRSIYAEIDRLEKAENIVESYQEYIEGFPPFLILALVILLCEVLLINTRLRSVP